MLQNVSSDERGEQKNILVSDIRKMYARQISKVQYNFIGENCKAKCAKT